MLVPDRRPDTIAAIGVYCPKCHAGSVAFVTYLRSLILQGNEARPCPKCSPAEPDVEPTAPDEPR